jgi:IMP dehydrogenase
MQELYQAPIQPELIGQRIAEIRAAGVTACGSLTPQRVPAYADAVLAAELDVLVIQGTVVSAEHVSKNREPLNLMKIIRELEMPVIVGGCASYQAALHLMRTGAAGVIVRSNPEIAGELGVGGPLATAIADARSARMRHLDETGAYCHVLAEGGIRTGGDIAKAVACGADAALLDDVLAGASDSAGGGWWWDHLVAHPQLPAGGLWREAADHAPDLAQLLRGPGLPNILGALRKAMAIAGYESVKELQKAELVVTAG